MKDTNLGKDKKPLKDKIKDAVSDFPRIQHEYSEKSGHLKDAKVKIANLTAELEALKAKYNDADFNFKKFDVSSEEVETMIEKQH